MAMDILKLHKDRVALPSDLVEAAREVVNDRGSVR